MCTSELKAHLYKKNEAVRARAKEDMRWVEKELKIKRAKTPINRKCRLGYSTICTECVLIAGIEKSVGLLS